MAFLHCPGGTDSNDSDGFSYDDVVAAVAAQSRAQKADDRANRLAATARAAEAEEDTARAAYRAAIARAVNARATADRARTDAARLITIYANGVSAKS